MSVSPLGAPPPLASPHTSEALEVAPTQAAEPDVVSLLAKSFLDLVVQANASGQVAEGHRHPKPVLARRRRLQHVKGRRGEQRERDPGDPIGAEELLARPEGAGETENAPHGARSFPVGATDSAGSHPP